MPRFKYLTQEQLEAAYQRQKCNACDAFPGTVWYEEAWTNGRVKRWVSEEYKKALEFERNKETQNR